MEKSCLCFLSQSSSNRFNSGMLSVYSVRFTLMPLSKPISHSSFNIVSLLYIINFVLSIKQNYQSLYGYMIVFCVILYKLVCIIFILKGI